MKFSGKVGNGPRNKWLNFGGHPDHRLDTGIVFRIRHYWEIRKVVNGYSFILIHQMAALARRTLAEICTVTVLLVLWIRCCLSFFCSRPYSIHFLPLLSWIRLLRVFVCSKDFSAWQAWYVDSVYWPDTGRLEIFACLFRLCSQNFDGNVPFPLLVFEKW